MIEKKHFDVEAQERNVRDRASMNFGVVWLIILVLALALMAGGVYVIYEAFSRYFSL